MSDHEVIYATSLTLSNLLKSRIKLLENQEIAVTVDSPHKENKPEPRVNLFLYHIVTDEFRRNTHRVPLPSQPGEQEFADDPLPIKLYYLATAFASDGLFEHKLLGEVMQVFHENQYVPEDVMADGLLDGTLRPQRIQLVLQNLTLEAINNIWGNRTSLMRASVGYEVSCVFLERKAPHTRVRLVEKKEIEVIPVPYIVETTPATVRPGELVHVYGANLAHPHLEVLLDDQPLKIESAKSRALAVRIPPGPPRTALLKLRLAPFESAERKLRIVGP